MIHNSLPTSTTSAAVVLGQVSCDFDITYSEGELRHIRELLEGNEIPKSHSAIQFDTRQSWQESYRPGELGKAVIMISYQHEPREARINATELLIKGAYPLWEDTHEKWLSQELTYAGDIVSILTRSPQTHNSNPDYKRLTNRLWEAFDSEVLEDGMDHPAEQIIGDAIDSTTDLPVIQWLKSIVLDAEQPSFASSVLRCLGRRPNIGTTSWRTQLVREALGMNDIEIRDAAVQAVESWRDRSLVEVVRAHTESEPWLQQYIKDVIDDLGE